MREATNKIRLELPYPPSLNNLFINVARKGRVPSPGYRKWRDRATERLWTQRQKNITGPVQITVYLGEHNKRDLDNCAKALIDFLVHHKLIDGDSCKTVRRIVLEWAEVCGAIVEVTPYPEISFREVGV